MVPVQAGRRQGSRSGSAARFRAGRGRTLFDELWEAHCVAVDGDGESLLYIDRVVVHERTGSMALDSLRNDARTVRRPEHAFCVVDHTVDTKPGRSDETAVPGGRDFIVATRHQAGSFGLRLFDVGDDDQGICHLVSAEQGIALPGLSLACSDSHTCTLGALGTLALGIGTTEAEHVLATSTLRLAKPRNLNVVMHGRIGPFVSAKDLALGLIAEHGVAGGKAAAVEFSGEAVAALGLDGRMTLCNMGAEFGAVTALVRPDEKVFAQAADTRYCPREPPLGYWRSLGSDDEAVFDRTIRYDVGRVEPRVTWGTSPEHGVNIGDRVPLPVDAAQGRALAYTGLEPGTPIAGVPIDAAFIGSCTNSRLTDLRAAADVLRNRRVAREVAAVCVPGSGRVKRAAEAEGLDRVFRDAGFEWRESGCSMCFYAGGETFGPGKRVITTTNRNFENRQGPGTRSHLASPLVVAASAVSGRITHPKDL